MIYESLFECAKEQREKSLVQEMLFLLSNISHDSSFLMLKSAINTVIKKKKATRVNRGYRNLESE